MAKRTKVKGEMSKKELDAFIKKVGNGGTVKNFSTKNFSIKQLLALEELQENELLTVELRTELRAELSYVCIIITVEKVERAEVVKSM